LLFEKFSNFLSALFSGGYDFSRFFFGVNFAQNLQVCAKGVRPFYWSFGNNILFLAAAKVAGRILRYEYGI